MKTKPAPSQTMLDLDAAIAAADVAIAQVDAAADATWMFKALDAVETCARVKHCFTTDDLKLYVADPSEPRAWGAVMVRAAKLGYCRATDRTQKSARVECHARPIRIWESLLI